MTVQPYPRRFACGMADALVLGSGIAFAFGCQAVGRVLAAAVLVIAGLVVATGLCVARSKDLRWAGLGGFLAHRSDHSSFRLTLS